MLKTNKLILQSCVVAAFAFAASAAQAHNTAENTGDKVENSAATMGSKIENTAEKVGDKIENAADKAGAKMKSLGNKAETTADNTADKSKNLVDNDRGKGDGKRSNNLVAADKQFVIKAAQANIAEVQLSKLAQDKATSEAAKEFARKMVTDHTLANSDLKFIASQKDVAFPEETDAKHKQELAKLQKLSGAAFDKAYMDAMTKSHAEALILFTRGAQNSKDADVKEYAQKVLQKIKEHHQMVGHMNAGGSARGAAAGGAGNK